MRRYKRRVSGETWLHTIFEQNNARILVTGMKHAVNPQLIAVGYALEQALNGRVEPDLEAAITEIDAVTGK